VLTHDFLNIKSCVVLCPLNVAANWEVESNLWLTNVEKKINFYNLSVKKDNLKLKRLQEFEKNGGIALIHYEGLLTLTHARPKKGLKQGKNPEGSTLRTKPLSEIRLKLKSLADKLLMNPQVLVCDEGHILRSDHTILHREIKKIPTKRKIILTGTPMQNNLMEYFYMIDIIKHNVLGDKTLFRNNYYQPINNGQHFDSRYSYKPNQVFNLRLLDFTDFFFIYSNPG